MDMPGIANVLSEDFATRSIAFGRHFAELGWVGIVSQRVELIERIILAGSI